MLIICNTCFSTVNAPKCYVIRTLPPKYTVSFMHIFHPSNACWIFWRPQIYKLYEDKRCFLWCDAMFSGRSLPTLGRKLSASLLGTENGLHGIAQKAVLPMFITVRISALSRLSIWTITVCLNIDRQRSFTSTIGWVHIGAYVGLKPRRTWAGNDQTCSVVIQPISSV